MGVCTCTWHCMCMSHVCLIITAWWCNLCSFTSTHKAIHTTLQHQYNGKSYYIRFMQWSIQHHGSQCTNNIQCSSRSFQHSGPTYASNIIDVVTKMIDMVISSAQTTPTRSLYYKFLLRRTLLIKRALTSVDELESSCWVVFALHFFNLVLEGKNLKRDQ